MQRNGSCYASVTYLTIREFFTACIKSSAVVPHIVRSSKPLKDAERKRVFFKIFSLPGAHIIFDRYTQLHGVSKIIFSCNCTSVTYLICTQSHKTPFLNDLSRTDPFRLFRYVSFCSTPRHLTLFRIPHYVSFS
jgi:hypothetical protein